MSLEPCKYCDHQVAWNAKACPNCGGTYPASLGFFGTIFAYLFWIIVIYGLFRLAKHMGYI